MSYVRWTAIYTLATVIERKVELSFGAWKLIPNLYIFLVGPPGMRKTATMEDFSSHLIEQVPNIVRGPDFFTKEYLVDRIAKSPRAAVYLMIGEFGDVFQKNGKELYDALITHYDAKKRLTEGTFIRGTQVIEKPCLNMIAGTTPTWIGANMGASVIGGGLASRGIWVFENELRAPRLWTDDLEDIDKFALLENDLLEDLIHISQLEGSFDVPRGLEYNQRHPQLVAYGDRDDRKKIEEWYVKLRSQKSDNNQISLYLARKHVQVLKLAMIHSIAQRDDLVLLWEDVQFGIQAVESTEPKLLRVFGGMGRNPHVEDTERIKDFVLEYTAQNGPVPEAIILDKYKDAATPRLLEELLAGLVKTEQISRLQRNEPGVDGDGRKIIQLKTYYGPGVRMLKEIGV